MQRTGGDAKREMHRKLSTAPLHTALTEVPVRRKSPSILKMVLEDWREYVSFVGMTTAHLGFPWTGLSCT